MGMLIMFCLFVQVITKLLYLLHQGETFTKVGAVQLLSKSSCTAANVQTPFAAARMDGSATASACSFQRRYQRTR
jgi:hypothetical protein